MSSDQKPKEFLFDPETGTTLTWKDHFKPAAGAIRLIEYSAYEKLKIELQKEESDWVYLSDKHDKTLDENQKLLGRVQALREIAEWMNDVVCKHAGELRQGSGRQWCHDCSSWVYQSDKTIIEKIKEALAKDAEENYK